MWTRLAGLTNSAAAFSNRGVRLQHLQSNHVQLSQSRFYWQEVFDDRVLDRFGKNNQGVPQYENEEAANEIEAMAARLDRLEKAEGLDMRHNRYVEHEKGWMKRKRLKNELGHRIKKTKVMELLRYIEWKKADKIKK